MYKKQGDLQTYKKGVSIRLPEYTTNTRDMLDGELEHDEIHGRLTRNVVVLQVHLHSLEEIQEGLFTAAILERVFEKKFGAL